VYPLAIASNFLLRLAWSLKLSSHLNARAGGGALVFAVEAAEVFRRWVWVFLRVEWECVKMADARDTVGTANTAPGLDEMEMGSVVFDNGDPDSENEKNGPDKGDYV
jgi:hypothetical protein